MPVYNYLPGVIVNTLDGGLVAPAAPQDDSILIFATAGQGPINTPVSVQDRTTSFNTFGAKGTLSRSVEECATYSDNITVLRIGAVPMQLENVGKDTTAGSATAGFSITFNGDVWATATMTTSLPSQRTKSILARAGNPPDHPAGSPSAPRERAKNSCFGQGSFWHRKPQHKPRNLRVASITRPIGGIVSDLDRYLIQPTLRRHPELLAVAQQKKLV
jgi:hypothetical protein